MAIIDQIKDQLVILTTEFNPVCYQDEIVELLWLTVDLLNAQEERS
jgi:hypothetical protein